MDLIHGIFLSAGPVGQPSPDNTTAVRLAPRSLTILAVGAVVYDRRSKRSRLARHVVRPPPVIGCQLLARFSIFKSRQVERPPAPVFGMVIAVARQRLDHDQK